MFGRRKIDAASALLERMTEAQAKQVEVFANFLTVISELSAKKAASVLGQRSGKARRAKREASVKQAALSSCPLCVDPMRHDVTVPMVEAHAQHFAAKPVTANGTQPAGVFGSGLEPPSDDN